MSVTDNFNRTDAATLGANWTELQGSPDFLQVLSNSARGTSAGVYQWATYTAVSWNSDQSSQVVASAVTSAVDCGVVLNAGAGVDGYMFMNHVSLGQRIYRRDDGSFTLLTDIGGLSATPFTTKADRSGSTLTMYKGGASQGTASDSTYTGGEPGIYSATQNSQDILDDWEGTGEASSFVPFPRPRGMDGGMFQLGGGISE